MNLFFFRSFLFRSRMTNIVFGSLGAIYPVVFAFTMDKHNVWVHKVCFVSQGGIPAEETEVFVRDKEWPATYCHNLNNRENKSSKIGILCGLRLLATLLTFSGIK